MGVVIEPLRQDQKLAQVIEAESPKRVLLFFWHGLGDLIMFLEPYKALQTRFPKVHFDLGLVKGIGQEDLNPAFIGFTGDVDLEKLDYDIVAKIHFPMSEGQEILTKGEFCCVHELGIEPVAGHSIGLCAATNRLVAVHFNITCLPASCNPDEETARKIWEEIRAAGYIPIESHFEHTFHNPVNKKFDFVESTVRKCIPTVAKLAGLIKNSAAFIGVVSGNFHVALSVLPPERILLLEKDFTAPMFTKLPVGRCSIKPYTEGEIIKWLTGLK
jgi:hypothetical protein